MNYSKFEALGLLTDGLKTELMERISDFVSQPAEVSRIAIFRSKVLPIQTSDQSVQVTSVEPILNTETQIKSWKFKLILFVVIVGFIGGCLAIAQFLFCGEKIEIPVRRSWFW